jgi:glycosyltransferase involved in cell wall biosynthesis
MRIGIITGEYPPMRGGVGAYTQILAHELAQQGEQIFVFSSIEAHNDNPNIRLTSRVKNWGVGSLRALHQWARDYHLDILNLQFQTAAYGMSPWVHFLPDTNRSIPVVTTFHDLRYPYLFPKAGRVREWMVRRLAQTSAGVIVTNHEDQARLAGMPQTTLIPIGSNILQPLPADFDATLWREQAGAKAGDFLLGYFGLFNHSKGIDMLLKALASLRVEGIPARLVMVGGGVGASDPTNETFMAAMNRQIQELDLAPVIYQTGYLENDADVGAYLAASDVVVLPFTDGASYRRGSLMAAIHYGCPIVTTKPQAAIPTFRDGENMLLVTPHNVSALKTALGQLHESTALRERLRKGAAELAKQFKWTKIARDYMIFFERVVGGFKL